MAKMSLGVESVRRNPISPAQRALIEAQLEAWIDLLDAADGDIDIEEDNEDCCPASDDEPARSLAGSVHPWVATEDDEEDNEDCCSGYDDIGGQDLPLGIVRLYTPTEDDELDYCDAPCVIHGAYQGTNGRGKDCDLIAGDDLEAGSIRFSTANAQ